MAKDAHVIVDDPLAQKAAALVEELEALRKFKASVPWEVLIEYMRHYYTADDIRDGAISRDYKAILAWLDANAPKQEG